MQLSKNFHLDEFIKSYTADKYEIDNTPNGAIVENIKALCNNVLQPIRKNFGVIKISSGYRCDKLNKIINGSLTSDHLLGQAADIKAPYADLYNIYEWVKFNIAYSECILYQDKAGFAHWIHVSYRRPNERQAFLKEV